MLRTRKSRREETLDAPAIEPIVSRDAGTNPENEALMADSVGLALLVVLDKLTPAERIAFVLHDMFAVPFDEIASIVQRSPEATRQLASRARHRVRGTDRVPNADIDQQRSVVEAFLAASRNGDFDALLAVLDPDVVVRADRSAVHAGAEREIRGASAVVSAARAYSARGRFTRPVLVNGAVGAVVAPAGRLMLVFNFSIDDGKVVEVDIIADPERLDQLDLAILDD
jgi:RNA polymerase sigma-70 factor (ECF subfamily)